MDFKGYSPPTCAKYKIFRISSLKSYSFCPKKILQMKYVTQRTHKTNIDVVYNKTHQGTF